MIIITLAMGRWVWARAINMMPDYRMILMILLQMTIYRMIRLQMKKKKIGARAQTEASPS
jgi:hypothetical protein